MRRERGAALVLVLWICAVVGLLVAGLTTTTVLESRRQWNQLRASDARAQIDSGLAHAVMGLLHPETRMRWIPDGRLYRVQGKRARIRLQVWDESGRLDINKAAEDRLVPVLGTTPEGRDLVAHILARRETRPFLSVLELAAPGTPGRQRLPELLPLLTVHNPLPGGMVSADTAPFLVLARWPGVTEATARRVVAARDVAAPGLAEADQQWLAGLGLMPAAAPTPELVTIRAEVETDDGARIAAEAVVRLRFDGGAAFRILEWREPAPTHSPTP